MAVSEARYSARSEDERPAHRGKQKSAAVIRLVQVLLCGVSQANEGARSRCFAPYGSFAVAFTFSAAGSAAVASGLFIGGRKFSIAQISGLRELDAVKANCLPLG
jgi:hypothetical protein